MLPRRLAREQEQRHLRVSASKMPLTNLLVPIDRRAQPGQKRVPERETGFRYIPRAESKLSEK